ncbi:hypothetical protein ACT6QH_11700 [Xanthobacter sp. TB0139]
MNKALQGAECVQAKPASSAALACCAQREVEVMENRIPHKPLIYMDKNIV